MTSPAVTPPPVFSRAAFLLLKGLDSRWERYQVCFESCCQEYSKEAVHDLRVATRRLLTMLEILETLFLTMKVHKLRRELKAQLDTLDELRDTQVQIAYVVDEMTGVEGIAPFLKHLYRREARLLSEVERLIRSTSLAEQGRRLEKIRASAESRLQAPEVRARMINAVDSAYANVVHRDSRIDPEDTNTIHRTRIAFKSFRYAVEVIHPLLVRYPDGLMKAMNDYQGWMGDIQDIEVLQEMLKAFGKKHPKVNLASSTAFVDQQHKELVAIFLSHRNALQGFWRLSPRQPYPWNLAKPAFELGRELT